MDKRIRMVWGISLMIIGASALVLSVSNIIGAELPDMMKRVIGVLDLIALPVMTYTTVRIVKK